MNFTDVYVPLEETTPLSTTETANKTSISPLIWFTSGACFIALMICFVISLYILYKMKPKKGDIEMGQHAIPPPLDYNLDKLKLINIIGK